MAIKIDAPEVNQFYVHYKGGIYVVLSLAEHTEREEQLVIYRHVSGAVYARPVDEWMKGAEVNGRHVARFTKIPPCFKLDLYGHPEASS